jgi:hypothetical protein
MTQRTALNYMQAYERFGAKSEMVSRLAPMTLYLLASPSTPDRIVDKVLAKLGDGEQLSDEAVRALVRAEKARAAGEAEGDQQLERGDTDARAAPASLAPDRGAGEERRGQSDTDRRAADGEAGDRAAVSAPPAPQLERAAQDDRTSPPRTEAELSIPRGMAEASGDIAREVDCGERDYDGPEIEVDGREQDPPMPPTDSRRQSEPTEEPPSAGQLTDAPLAGYDYRRPATTRREPGSAGHVRSISDVIDHMAAILASAGTGASAAAIAADLKKKLLIGWVDVFRLAELRINSRLVAAAARAQLDACMVELLALAGEQEPFPGLTGTRLAECLNSAGVPTEEAAEETGLQQYFKAALNIPDVLPLSTRTRLLPLCKHLGGVQQTALDQ